ncbi:MAG: ComF family protein, partial [Candidatus Latescibacterota bacterium]
AALDLLIPVPLHAARQREWGHNQAKEIAVGLSESLGIPLDDGCCASLPADATAARLDASERAANTGGAFETMRSPLGWSARIGLVDDVLTTGATLSACASALSRATGAHVIGLAVASPFR